MKNKLKPKLSKNINMTGNSVRIAHSPQCYQSNFFRWCISEDFIDYEHEVYGWNRIKLHEFCKESGILFKFLEFSKKKWGECEKIAGSKRHKSWHPIEYDGFQGKDRRYLEKKYGDKISVFYQISLSGRERIIGYKDIDIFYPIWYDENHEVLPTKK